MHKHAQNHLLETILLQQTHTFKEDKSWILLNVFDKGANRCFFLLYLLSQPCCSTPASAAGGLSADKTCMQQAISNNNVGSTAGYSPHPQVEVSAEIIVVCITVKSVTQDIVPVSIFS